MSNKLLVGGFLLLGVGLCFGCTAKTCLEIARKDECTRVLNNQKCEWDSREQLCIGSFVLPEDCGTFGKNACEQAYQTCLWLENACITIPACKALGRKPVDRCMTESSASACTASASVGNTSVCTFDAAANEGSKCVYDIEEAIKACKTLDQSICSDTKYTNGFCQWQ